MTPKHTDREETLALVKLQSTTGKVLRAIISNLPGGAAIVSVATDQALENLHARLAAVENAFVDAEHRVLLSSHAHAVIDGFQIIRLRNFLARALEIDESHWCSDLADQWASYLVDNDDVPEIRREIDRVMLALEPHDHRLLQASREYYHQEEARRIEQIGSTSGAPIGICVSAGAGFLQWPPAVVQAAMQRVISYGLVVDAALNTVDGYMGPRLGELTQIGELLLERLKRFTNNRNGE